MEEYASRQMESMITKELLAILNEVFISKEESDGIDSNNNSTDSNNGSADTNSNVNKKTNQKKKRVYIMIFKMVFKGLCKSVLTLIILHSVRNAGHLAEYAKSAMKWFIYKKMILTDSYMIQGIRKYISNGTNDQRMLPIYMTNIVGLNSTAEGNETKKITTKEQQASVEYVPIIHQETIEIIEKNAIITKQLESQKLPIIRDILVKDRTYQALNLFPSRNYVQFNNTLQNFFNAVKLTGMHTVCGIIINGIPGLGKSKSCDFIAEQCLYDQIYYMNLSLPEYMAMDFKKIVNLILAIPSDHGTTVVYIDEFDKYVASVVKTNYSKLSKASSQKATFSQYDASVKETILSEVLRLFETRLFSFGIVYVFCSNHSETIFQNVNMTHYSSLQDRFTSIEYVPCNKKELIEYIRYFGAKMGQTYDEYLFDSIPKNILVTFRTVYHCHVKSNYDVKKWIELLNQEDKKTVYGKVGAKGKEPKEAILIYEEVQSYGEVQTKDQTDSATDAATDAEAEVDSDSESSSSSTLSSSASSSSSATFAISAASPSVPSPSATSPSPTETETVFFCMSNDKTKCDFKTANKMIRFIGAVKLDEAKEMIDSNEIGIDAEFGLNGNNYTCLSYAVGVGKQFFVPMLLEFEPNINIPIGRGAFYLAYTGGYYQIMELFLENEFTRNQIDLFKYFSEVLLTPSQKTLELFVKYNFDFKVINENNENLFFYAYGSVVINFLQTQGVNPNHLNDFGSALHYIVRNELPQTTFQYLSKMVDLSLCDSNGQTVKDLIKEMGLGSKYILS